MELVISGDNSETPAVIEADLPGSPRTLRPVSGSEFRLPSKRSRTRVLLQTCLLFIDAASLLAAVTLSGVLWLNKWADPNGFTEIVTLIGFYGLIAINANAFSSDILGRRRYSMIISMRSVVFASAGVILAAFFFKAGQDISRMQLLIGGVFGTIIVGSSRVMFHSLVIARFGTDLKVTVILSECCTIEVPDGVYHIDAAKVGLRSDLADPLMLRRLSRMLSPADRVIIACAIERRRDWSLMLKSVDIKAEIVSPELNDMRPLGIGEFGGSATMIVAVGSLDLRQRFLKRGLDLMLAALSVFFLAPVFAIVAIAIKIDSRGPIFFVQDRVGRGNRLFGIYKFRSMRVDAGDLNGSRSTSREDDRITKVGKFIRATSLDELPQLFNVLIGEMSFVGPRPHALGSRAEDVPFWEIDERYWHRHVCKPGMTGLAQIRGYRGATSQRSDLINRLQADLEYVAKWTVMRDVVILFATLRVVVHRNAF